MSEVLLSLLKVVLVSMQASIDFGVKLSFPDPLGYHDVLFGFRDGIPIIGCINLDVFGRRIFSGGLHRAIRGLECRHVHHLLSYKVLPVMLMILRRHFI